MHKTLAGTGLTLLLLSSTATAEGMAGISLGQALYDDEALATFAANAGGPSTSYKIFGGMAIGSHLSAHAGLFSLGKRSGKTLETYLIDTGNGTTETGTYTTSSARIEIDGFFLEGRWQWRAGSAWRPYIKLGGALVNSKTDTFIAGTGYTMVAGEVTHSSFSLVPGLGLVWESLHHWGLQLEAESYQKVKSAETSGIPDQNITNINLGIYGYW
ncbi:MAG: hypothetical protein REI12_05380 [Pedobacter sp.]|nr:hypothetical protein [Pedobacter sp.]